MIFKQKAILVLLFLLSASLVVNGQAGKKKFQIGMTFGPNLSMFNKRFGEFGANKNEDYINGLRLGGSLGLKSKIVLSKVVFLQPEALFILKGGSYNQENSSVFILGSGGKDDKAYYRKIYRLNYFEFPVLAGFNLTKLFNENAGDDFNISLSAGVAPSINVGSTFKYNDFSNIGSGFEVNEDFTVDKFDYAKHLAFSNIIDLSINFLDGQGVPMSFNFRWTQTFGGVYNVPELKGYSMDTNVSTFSLGYSVMFHQEEK